MRKQDLAALSRKRHVLAKPSKAQQEATCSHLTRCFANGRGCAPPNPPALFFGQLLSKQIFARLSKKYHFAVLFDVLQVGGCAPRKPPLIFIAPHSQARPSSAEQETTWRYFFQFLSGSESSKASTVMRMATLTPEIPATVDTFEFPSRCESPKTSTVTRMATLFSAIPVVVDIFEFRTSSESRKTSTVTRMATVTPAIPVTVDAFRI